MIVAPSVTETVRFLVWLLVSFWSASFNWITSGSQIVHLISDCVLEGNLIQKINCNIIVYLTLKAFFFAKGSGTFFCNQHFMINFWNVNKFQVCWQCSTNEQACFISLGTNWNSCFISSVHTRFLTVLFCFQSFLPSCFPNRLLIFFSWMGI